MQNPCVLCHEDFKSCFSEQAAYHIANADIEESAHHASYYLSAYPKFYFH